jgi:transcriptional regulator with GAF, ATPase, and Fis domain/pSer/pThr/pTyr-binding forkhead associated (FHA) protein
MPIIHPRLVAVDGQWKGTLFPLDEPEVQFGRDSSNQILLTDPSVSRAHCVMEATPAGYRLKDLESRNGTFVNGIPVRVHELQNGDRVEIGRSAFIYLTLDDDPSTGETPSSRISLVTRMVVPVHAGGENRPASVAGNDLQVLMRVGTAVHSMKALYSAKEAGARETLERHILELIFESVPAERGAIVLRNESIDFPNQIWGWSRTQGRVLLPVDPQTIHQVMTEGVAILSNNVDDPEIRCIVAVPLSVSGRVLGMIYLDSTVAEARFDEERLQFLTVLAEIAAVAVDNARYVELILGENRRLREEISVQHSMVGESPAMQQIYQFISRVSKSDSSVLITGESGTGKELVARAIHENSNRSNQPFVAINCAALTETLLESEFFGHEKGAFTGAITQKKGKLEIAESGTVFLDEIGEMAPGLQAKLLRVLQEHAFERVGGTRSIPTNIRIIAATNRNLQDAIKTGHFRLDLFYRLNVVSIEMPTLRDRKQDIPLLTQYFLARICRNLKRSQMTVSQPAMAYLMQYDWPGNIRELENAIERAVVLGSSDAVLPEDLPAPILEIDPPSGLSAGKFQSAVQDTKKQAILNAIEQSNGNITAAARMLEVHPNYLHRLIRNMNLRPLIKKMA